MQITVLLMFFSLFLNKAGTSYMLREYSSKERKVEDLLELKVCIDLGFLLASHAKRGGGGRCNGQNDTLY